MNEKITYEWTRRLEGQSTILGEVVPDAYAECSELQTTPYEVTYTRIIESTEENERYEFCARIGSEVVAVAIVVEDHDIHVGPSWTIQWNYVKPEYRSLGIARHVLQTLRKLAKQCNVPYSYTKRVGEGKYLLTYKY